MGRSNSLLTLLTYSEGNELPGLLRSMGPRARMERAIRIDGETPWWSPLRLILLAPIDLEGVDLVPKPLSWRHKAAARQAFASTWCQNQIDTRCDPDGVHSAAFEEAWEIERAATLDAVPAYSLLRADFRRADLRSAFLSGVEMGDARLGAAWLWDANLEGADLRRVDLAQADLRRANLEDVNLVLANLAGANLEDANLDGADLWGADLTEASLYGTNLVGADLGGTNLEAAGLSGANLEQANLEGADLSEADLHHANLRQVTLMHANLERADLSGVGALDTAQVRALVLTATDLSRTDLNYPQLDTSIYRLRRPLCLHFGR